MGEAEEGGGKSVMGRDRRERVERRDEESEEERERGFRHPERVDPLSVVGGRGGEEAVEPARRRERVRG